jgi:hypothetical protein
MNGPEGSKLRDSERIVRQPFHNRAFSSRIRLDANAIIEGRSNPLLTAKGSAYVLQHMKNT